MINIKDSFKDYKNYEDWANQYINLLTNKRYGKAFSMSEQEFMPYIIKQGYATDPNYISKYNKVLNEVKKYEVGGKIQRFKDGKPVKKAMTNGNYGTNLTGWQFFKGRMMDSPFFGALCALGLCTTENAPEYRRNLLYNRHNPSRNEATAIVDYLNLEGAHKPRPKSLSGTPAEEAFYARYHYLPQDLIKSTNIRRPNGKDDNLKDAEFVTTTKGMDLRMQALADTLNLGKLARMSPELYKKLQEKHEGLVDQEDLKKSYAFSKDLLDHPNVPKQAHEDLSIKKEKGADGGNYTGLGALRYYGMQWDDKDKQIYGWDSYNFDWWQRLIGSMPAREKSLEIRTKIPFDPTKGSKLLRDNLQYFDNE